MRYYPAARYVFKSGSTRLHCEFVLAYPDPAMAATLSWPAFQEFAQKHHYPRPQQLPACFQRLQQPYPPVCPEVSLAYKQAAQHLALALRTSLEIKERNLT